MKRFEKNKEVIGEGRENREGSEMKKKETEQDHERKKEDEGKK